MGTGSAENPMILSLAPGKLPTFQCHSDTRPDDPTSGQFIFESDTNNVRVWNGAKWLLVKAWNDVVRTEFPGVGSSGHTTGTLDVLTATVTNPWEATDSFVIDAVGQLSFATGSPGVDSWDQWEVRLLVEARSYDKQRVTGNAIVAPYVDAKTVLQGYRSAGGPVNLTLRLVYVGGSGNYQLFNDDPLDPITRISVAVRPA